MRIDGLIKIILNIDMLHAYLNKTKKELVIVKKKRKHAFNIGLNLELYNNIVHVPIGFL